MLAYCMRPFAPRVSSLRHLNRELWRRRRMCKLDATDRNIANAWQLLCERDRAVDRIPLRHHLKRNG